MADTNIIVETNRFTPNHERVILDMRGHPDGIIQYLLNLMGIDTRVNFTVTRKHIEFRFSNLGGQSTIICPLDSVTGMFGGLKQAHVGAALGKHPGITLFFCDDFRF